MEHGILIVPITYISLNEICGQETRPPLSRMKIRISFIIAKLINIDFNIGQCDSNFKKI